MAPWFKGFVTQTVSLRLVEDTEQRKLTNRVRVEYHGTNANSQFALHMMAIGWGKSYEEQMEEASQRASIKKAPRVPSEDRVRKQKLDSLKLSRSRIEAQLEKAVHQAHRQTLMKALQAVEKEIDEVNSAV